MNAAPISADEFAAAMAALGLTPDDGPFAVAVSGGADSLALTLLAARHARILAFTVDHRLRPDSQAETRAVHDMLTARGIAHEILVHDGAVPARNLEAAARQARYRLLEAACMRAGIRHLLIAHHREDQAETLLLRLARGSGLEGLAAMRSSAPPLTDPLGPWRHRPLLDFPRARLRATVHAAGLVPIEDPTNADPRHLRNRLRRMLADGALAGLDPARLAATAARLRRAQDALDRDVDALLARAATVHPDGHATLRRRPFLQAPAEIALRALARLLVHLSDRVYGPRMAALERLREALADGGFRGATLAGCRIAPAADGTGWLIAREAAAMEGPRPLPPGRRVRWDGRFDVRLKETAGTGWTAGPLAPLSWREIAARFGPAAVRELRALPGIVRPTLAVLRDADGRMRAIAGIAAAKADPACAEFLLRPHPPLLRGHESPSACRSRLSGDPGRSRMKEKRSAGPARRERRNRRIARTTRMPSA